MPEYSTSAGVVRLGVASGAAATGVFGSAGGGFGDDALAVGAAAGFVFDTGFDCFFAAGFVVGCDLEAAPAGASSRRIFESQPGHLTIFPSMSALGSFSFLEHFGQTAMTDMGINRLGVTRKRYHVGRLPAYCEAWLCGYSPCSTSISRRDKRQDARDNPAARAPNNVVIAGLSSHLRAGLVGQGC